MILALENKATVGAFRHLELIPPGADGRHRQAGLFAPPFQTRHEEERFHGWLRGRRGQGVVAATLLYIRFENRSNLAGKPLLLPVF